MTAIVLVTVGLLGLAVGSFLNVVIHRVPRDLSVVRPGSRCPACGSVIRNRHNVPVVGWLVLRGRCADCRQPISIRYPLVEAITAALFVAITARFGFSFELPAFLYLAAVAVALAAIDIDFYRLPTVIVGPSYLVGVALLALAAVGTSDYSSLLRALAGMALVGLFYLGIKVIAPNGMGAGDVRLAGLLGLFLGWVSWATILVGTLGGFVIGSAVGLALMGVGRAKRGTHIPFGPAMLAGALLALFVAAPIASWYVDTLSFATT